MMYINLKKINLNYGFMSFIVNQERQIDNISKKLVASKSISNLTGCSMALE